MSNVRHLTSHLVKQAFAAIEAGDLVALGKVAKPTLERIDHARSQTQDEFDLDFYGRARDVIVRGALSMTQAA